MTLRNTKKISKFNFKHGGKFFNNVHKNSNGLSKMGPGARKVEGVPFSVSKQSDKALKKGHCFRGGHYLAYHNKVISKKKRFLF